MHRSLFLFVVLVTLTAGCSGGEENRKRSPVGRLNDGQYERLKSLNRLQQDNIDAREYAHHNLIGPALSEKSKAMGEKIAHPNCVRTGHIPADDMTGAINEQTIGGRNCPIYWYRRRGITMPDKIMNVADRLVIESDDYRKNFSALHVRSFAGSYSVIPDGAGHRVFGLIKINEFSTVEFGRLEGNIIVEHRKKYDDANGHVTLTLTSPRGWRHTASILWTLRRGTFTVDYRVDNVKVEEQGFNELFSAYELDKFMDNALKMK